MWTFKANVANLSVFANNQPIYFKADRTYTTKDGALAKAMLELKCPYFELVSAPEEKPKQKIIVDGEKDAGDGVDHGSGDKKVLPRTGSTKKISLQ